MAIPLKKRYFHGWWQRNRDTVTGALALCVGGSMAALSMSLHHPICSAEVRVDLGEHQTFSPACARETLARLHGQENMLPGGENTTFGLRHTSVGITLSLPADGGGSKKTELFFDLVPASTTDQMVLSFSWDTDDELTDKFGQFMSKEISQDLDAIYEACVGPKTEPWVAHCPVVFGDLVICPQPTSTRAAAPRP